MNINHPVLAITSALCVAASLAGCGGTTTEPDTQPEPRASTDDGVDTAADAPQAAADRSTDETTHAAQVQADVQAIMNATAEGDTETLRRFTHPKVVQLAGGDEPFKSLLEAGLETVKQSGLTFGELTFPQPPRFIRTESRLYAIIPTKIVMTMPAGGVEVRSYQLGVLEEDSTEWKYVDISKHDPATTQDWFSDFPRDAELPEVSMKQL